MKSDRPKNEVKIIDRLKTFLNKIPLLRALNSRKISWIAIGDSITYLSDKPELTAHRFKKGYISRVASKIPELYYVNQGYYGWTSADIASSISWLGLTRADIYTVFLGNTDWAQEIPLGTFNDYRNNTGTGTVYGSFKIIISKLRQLNEAAAIILITPLPCTDYTDLDQHKKNIRGCYREKAGLKLSRIADAVIEIARYEKIHLVDVYNKSGITLHNLSGFNVDKKPGATFANALSWPPPTGTAAGPEEPDGTDSIETPSSAYEGIYPTDKGYAVIAGMIQTAIKASPLFRR